MDKRRRTIFAHSLSQFCLPDTVKKEILGWNGVRMVTRKETFSSASSPGVHFLSLLTPSSWKLTSTLELHYQKLKNTVSMLQVARECCYEPRGELVYTLITVEYKLNINFRPDKIFRNSSTMYNPTKFVLFFNISFSSVNQNRFVFSTLFSACINDEISITSNSIK